MRYWRTLHISYPHFYTKENRMDKKLKKLKKGTIKKLLESCCEASENSREANNPERSAEYAKAALDLANAANGISFVEMERR